MRGIKIWALPIAALILQNSDYAYGITGKVDKALVCGGSFSESPRPTQLQLLYQLYDKLRATVPKGIQVKLLSSAQSQNALASYHVPTRTLYLKEINDANVSVSIAALAHELWHIHTSERLTSNAQSALRLFLGESRPWSGSYPNGFSIDEWPAYLTELHQVASHIELHPLFAHVRFKPSQYFAQISGLVQRAKKSTHFYSEFIGSNESMIVSRVEVQFNQTSRAFHTQINKDFTLHWPSDLGQIDLRVKGYIYSIRTTSEEQNLLRTLKEGRLNSSSKANLLALLSVFDQLISKAATQADLLEQQLELYRSEIVSVGSRSYGRLSPEEQHKRALQLALIIKNVMVTVFGSVD